MVPDEDPAPAALAWPAKPRAATADRAAVSVSETATVTRVTVDTDRIPRSRTWALRRVDEDPFRLVRMSLMRHSLGRGPLGLIGNALEDD